MNVMILKLNKIFLLSIFIILLLVFGIFVFFVNANKSAVVNSKAKKIPIYSVESTQKELAIGFNAAWDNSDSKKLMDILDKYNVKATFFVTGEWVDKYESDVKEFYNKGHKIENHSNTHPHVANISKEQLIQDTKKCDDKIEKAIGRRPTLYRAPYGEYDNEMLEVFEKELGHKVIQWDVDSRDWKPEYTTDKIVSTVLNNVHNGSILLFHNGAANTPEALDIILEKLISKDYKIKLIEDMLIKGDYYIDANGRMIAKQ